MPKQKQLTTRQYLSAMLNVAKLSFRIAPGSVSFKMVGIVVNAALPNAITFFAAQTITELTAAYNGSEEAGQRAILYVVAAASLGLFSTAWASLDSYIQQLMRFKIEAKVSDIMYEKFLSLDYWRYDDKDTVDTYDRAQKFSQFYAYIFNQLSALITQLTTMLFALIVLFVFMPWMAIIVFLSVIPGLYIQFKISRGQLRHWNKNVDARRTQTYIEYNMFHPAAIAELRLNGLIKHMMQLRQKLRDKDQGERLKFERGFLSKQLLSDALEAAVELGSLLWIVFEIINQRQPLGQFIYVQQLVSRTIGSANSFIKELSSIDEDLGNLYDYQKFMNLPSSTTYDKKPVTSTDKITISNVTFRYPKTKTDALTNVSIEIKKGQHVAIVGENGSGKSTLIKLIAGMYRPTKGHIFIDEMDLNTIDLISWQKQLSVLQQEFLRYHFANARDNVLFGNIEKNYDKEHFWQSMQNAEALDFVKKLPKKELSYLDPWMEDKDGNPGTSLSGGQWQRLALARSFFRDSPIIIMDEPTSAIDAAAEARIFDRIFSDNQKKTVITISHRLSTVEKADKIFVLANGKLVESGTHTQLVAKTGYYFRLFKRQLNR